MATTSPLRGLSTVSFFAADHVEARKLYTEFPGVEPYERPGYVEFRIGDCQHELGIIIDGDCVPGVESNNGRAGVVVCWHVDDVNADLGRAVGNAPCSWRHRKTVAMASSPPQWSIHSTTSRVSCTTRMTFTSWRRSNRCETTHGRAR